MTRLIFAALVLFCSTVQASATRSLDADSLTSSDKTKTYTLPSSTQTLVGRTSSESLSNKTMAGDANTFSKLPVGADFIQETPSGSINSSNVTFTLANTPPANSAVIVILDGMPQIGGSVDYSISGTTITFTTAPATGQSLRAVYQRY